MKTTILTIAIALASALSALAQTVMRENSTVYFQTNVFLHDDPTNALHSRIATLQTGKLDVAAAAAYLPLSGYDGLVVLGTRTRGYAASTNLGSYGFAAGELTSAGDFGFAAGESASAGYAGFAAGSGTSAGDFGFAAGDGTSAGEAGFAAGSGTSAGDYGFATGRGAKGADGSFVFADNSSGGTPFNRTNRPNEFSARAAGGVYFDTPLMAVTGTVSAGSFAFGDGTVPVFTSWLESDGTNLFFISTVPPGFTNALTTNAP